MTPIERPRWTRPARGHRLTRAATAVALFTLVGFHALPVQAQDCEDVSGAWTVDLVLPDGSSQQVTVTLEQSDCGVSGAIVGNTTTSFEDGSVEGSTFSFVSTVANQADGSPIAIDWEGTVDGDDLTGAISSDLFGRLEFTGKRADGSTV